MANYIIPLCVLMACSLLATTGTSLKRSEGREMGVMEEMSAEKMAVNKLMHRLLDAVEETYKDLGASDEELGNMRRKRGYVTACYFSSITCY